MLPSGARIWPLAAAPLSPDRCPRELVRLRRPSRGAGPRDAANVESSGARRRLVGGTFRPRWPGRRRSSPPGIMRASPNALAEAGKARIRDCIVRQRRAQPARPGAQANIRAAGRCPIFSTSGRPAPRRSISSRPISISPTSSTSSPAIDAAGQSPFHSRRRSTPATRRRRRTRSSRSASMMRSVTGPSRSNHWAMRRMRCRSRTKSSGNCSR